MAGVGARRGALHAKAPPRLAGEPPELKTRRLTLRGLRLADAARIKLLAGDRGIVENTVQIPHPYGVFDVNVAAQAFERVSAQKEAVEERSLPLRRDAVQLRGDEARELGPNCIHCIQRFHIHRIHMRSQPV